MYLEKALELAKNKSFQEALPYFEKAYETERESFNEWSWYFYSSTLGKVGKLDYALKVNHFLYKKNPDFRTNTNLYSWHLYKKVIKNTEDENQLYSAANFIVNNTKQEQYSAYERTVLDVIKFIKSKPATNYNQLLYWSDLLDPKLLSRETYSFTDQNGKRRELASPLESWYQYRIKALFETKQYEGCILTAREALSSIKSFHYNNDIWFRIKEAVSISHLGNTDEAIKRLHEITKENQHWTVYQELFHLYKQKDEVEKALEMGAFALLERSGEYKHKIKLLIYMGDILEKMGHLKEALQHYNFVSEIRLENNWPANQRLVERIAVLKQVECNPVNSKRELLSFWKDLKLNSLPKGKGIVKSLFPKGHAGFITSDDGEDIYFQVRNIKNQKIRVDCKVSYYIINSYDQRKQRESKEAIEIKILNK
ncbi:hypothetical protein [Bacillus sp. EB01]|uniref:hypothetical protein n=1 Tax=Bacillus sp. EB01 TaxID=1347086 RepID=UPI0005C4CF15|nr:hypothetical protein [Bacillus sp. EB01]